MAAKKGALAKANTTVVSATDAERQLILSQATDDFRTMYDKISKQLATETTDIIQSRHKIGGWIASMEPEASGKKNYGARAIDRMVDVVGMGRDIIYVSLQIWKKFPGDEIEKFIGLRNKAGQPLTWTHLRHLITISDKDTRKEMQKVALDGNLTPGELLAYIQKRQGKKNGHAGKPMARPKSLRGFIDQQTAALEQILGRKNKVWAGKPKESDKTFFEVLAETPPDKLDKNLMTDLAKLEGLFEKTSTEMESMATELFRVRKKIEQSKAIMQSVPLNLDDDDKEVAVVYEHEDEAEEAVPF